MAAFCVGCGFWCGGGGGLLFYSGFVRVGGGVVAREGALLLNFSIRGHLPPQSLRKIFFNLWLWCWGCEGECGFGFTSVVMWVFNNIYGLSLWYS